MRWVIDKDWDFAQMKQVWNLPNLTSKPGWPQPDPTIIYICKNYVKITSMKAMSRRSRMNILSFLPRIEQLRHQRFLVCLCANICSSLALIIYIWCDVASQIACFQIFSQPHTSSVSENEQLLGMWRQSRLSASLVSSNGHWPVWKIALKWGCCIQAVSVRTEQLCASSSFWVHGSHGVSWWKGDLIALRLQVKLFEPLSRKSVWSSDFHPRMEDEAKAVPQLKLFQLWFRWHIRSDYSSSAHGPSMYASIPRPYAPRSVTQLISSSTSLKRGCSGEWFAEDPCFEPGLGFPEQRLSSLKLVGGTFRTLRAVAFTNIKHVWWVWWVCWLSKLLGHMLIEHGKSAALSASQARG